MKLMNIEESQSAVNFIRAHTVDLYARYKVFAGVFDREADVNLLLKLVAELEAAYINN